MIFIILSMQTEEYAYREVYETFRGRYKVLKDVLDEPKYEVANTIQHGGLQNKKATYIKGALQKIEDDFGSISLDELVDWSDEEVLRYLKSLPGISTKSARCIMMYTMERDVFPVDTHVWRICRRLGLTPEVPKPTEKQQRELEAKVPPDIRYSLHVNMVTHGRETCLTYWPKCEECVLADICPSKGKPDRIWGEWRQPGGAWAGYTEKKQSG